MAHMAFRWCDDNGSTFNAGSVALSFFGGSGPVFTKKQYRFVIYQGSMFYVFCGIA